MTILLAVVLFGILVFIHEAGHFAVAKWSGVYVERFALGFGPALLKKKWGETEYAICAFPLGGYVKMRGEGMDVPEGESQPDDPRSFAALPVGKRIAIVAMGPISNLILPIFLFSALFFVGMPIPTSTIGGVIHGYPAADNGLRPGDKIVGVENSPIETWSELMVALKDRANVKTTLRIRRGEKEFNQVLTPIAEKAPNMFGEMKEVGKIGISVQPYRPSIGIPNPTSRAARAGLKTGDTIAAVNGKTIDHLWQLEDALADKSGKKSLTVERFTTSKSEPKTLTISLNASSLKQAGLEDGELFLRDIQPDSIAEEKGLKVGDKLLALNQKPLRSWHAFREGIQKNKGEAVVVEVLRKQRRVSIELIPREVLQKDEITKEQRKTRQLGVISSASPGMPDFKTERYLNPFKAFARGFAETVEISKVTVIGLGKLVRGKLGMNSVGGPIAIFVMAGSSYERGGWLAYFRLMAILSITLAILNFLPIPILDGGHLFFFFIEAIKGSPVHLRIQQAAQQVGLVLILGLMALTFYVDINRYVVERIRSLFN